MSVGPGRVRGRRKVEAGLEGVYEFTLVWAVGATEFGPNGRSSAIQADQSAPPLTTALREQLGLRLQTQRLPVDAFVIDALAMPTPN